MCERWEPCVFKDSKEILQGAPSGERDLKPKNITPELVLRDAANLMSI